MDDAWVKDRGVYRRRERLLPPSTCSLLMVNHLIGFGAGGSTEFSPLGVKFTRATPDYYERGSDFAGNADSTLASGHFWMRADGNDGASMAIFDSPDSGGNQFHIDRDTGNKLRITAINTGASATFQMNGSTNLSNANFGSAWFCVMWALDWSSLPNAAKTLIYVQGAADTVTDSSNAASGTLDLTHPSWRVGNTSGLVPGGALDGCLAEFFVHFGVFIDWSNSANRDKVIAGGRPVDPGATGSLVTGSQPLVYLSVRPGEAVTAFPTNRGSGGSFGTTSGTPALSSTNP